MKVDTDFTGGCKGHSDSVDSEFALVFTPLWVLPGAEARIVYDLLYLKSQEVVVTMGCGVETLIG